MSLHFGLNVKPKGAAASTTTKVPKRATIFDEEYNDDNDDGAESHRKDQDLGEDINTYNGAVSHSSFASKSSRPTSRAQATTKAPLAPPTLKARTTDRYSDLSANRAAEKRFSTATDLDSSIYDYDTFHDAHTAVSAARKAAERQDAIERKPKYMDKLLDAASRRKQDQLVAREKLLQKEREAEGDEFADKEKFVTGAYKAQQEETRRLEEEERKKAESDERARKAGAGGMQGFYRGMMADSERKHQEAMEAAQRVEQGETAVVDAGPEQKTDADLAAELKAKGLNVHVNEEGQVTDKRQLLSAGLNVAPSGSASDKRSADHLKTGARSAQQTYQGRNRNDQRAMRERQTQMLEQQLAESAKRAADEEAEEQRVREHAAKSRKTESDISSAKERYLARKREAEAAKKAG